MDCIEFGSISINGEVIGELAGPVVYSRAFVEVTCLKCRQTFHQDFACGAVVFDEDLLRWVCESCIFDSRPVKEEPA